MCIHTERQKYATHACKALRPTSVDHSHTHTHLSHKHTHHAQTHVHALSLSLTHTHIHLHRDTHTQTHTYYHKSADPFSDSPNTNITHTLISDSNKRDQQEEQMLKQSIFTIHTLPCCYLHYIINHCKSFRHFLSLWSWKHFEVGQNDTKLFILIIITVQSWIKISWWTAKLSKKKHTHTHKSQKWSCLPWTIA